MFTLFLAGLFIGAMLVTFEEWYVKGFGVLALVMSLYTMVAIVLEVIKV